MYLGLDLGTSGLKGVLVDEAGTIHATHTAAISAQHPHSGWSEQDPQSWIQAARAVLQSLGDLSQVRAIGLSGQMHGATCLDAKGEVIRPCILWNDTRAHEEAAALDAMPMFRDVTGNIVFPGFTAPKILWMQKHEPENFARMDKVLLPKDYLRFWLTGEFVSETSDASGTSWLDVGARQWSAELVEASGLSMDAMPALVEGWEASAKIRAALAREFGLSADTVVAGGAGDNAATAMGLDIVKPGTGFFSLGTSGVVFAANAAFHPDPASALHAFCHAAPATWHQMGVTLSATDSLNWLARQLDEKPAALVNAIGDLEAPTAELFLPFLGGERTPYNSATLRAEFKNLGHSTDRAALTRAVLEGVSFSLKTCLDLMENSDGAVKKLLAVGGGAQSDYWLELLATILEREIIRPEGAENAAAIGAARLGAQALGEDIALYAKENIFKPDLEHTKSFAEKYLVYQKACEISLE